ncbi:MAG: nucleoside-diphosphate kinase [Candidatus Methylacidiphilales bacterium]|nr:nucleoside-diphosphate kinase [Candidatus Methylacidiphilales bacterium]
MEKTLILLKPDCLKNSHCGEVIGRFEKAGFAIRGCKMIRLTDAILAEHYAHVASKPFYPEIKNFMQSAPVIALILEGDKAVERIRELLGPTDSTKAAKGTIRGDLGKSVMVNVVHASDSPENAALEIQRFFLPAEVFAY